MAIERREPDLRVRLEDAVLRVRAHDAIDLRDLPDQPVRLPAHGADALGIVVGSRRKRGPGWGREYRAHAHADLEPCLVVAASATWRGNVEQADRDVDSESLYVWSVRDLLQCGNGDELFDCDGRRSRSKDRDRPAER